MQPVSLLFSDILKSTKYDPKRYSQSLYIGLNLHGGNVSELAIKGGEDPKDYHVTLLWGLFNPRSDIDDTVCRIQSVMDAIKNDIPKKVVFYHERRFEASESSDNKDVIVAAVAGGELEAVHKKLMAVLKEEGITVEKTFPEYVPHLTLAYIDPGSEHECRVLDHSALVKDITVCIKERDSGEKMYERTFDMVAKSFSDILKFNPYHDRAGRFAAANSAASFTYKPGASTAHSKAIEREKARAAETGKGFKGTLYHGSPNTDIEEFDMKRAGQNTSSGEKLLFFTDSKQMADDFSYERLEGSSKFFQQRGKKGRVYEVDVEMKNPLDFRNLSDKDIDNIIKLDEDGILTKQDVQRYAQSNHQLLKAGLTLTSESLKELGYDGLIANTGKAGHNSLEYAVVDSKQAKIRKSQSFHDILKFNPYHDRLGRFTSAGAATSFTIRTRSKLSQGAADMSSARAKERMASIMPTAAQEKTLKGIERRTRNLKKEQLRVVDRDGNVVMQKQGTKDSVSYKIGEAREHFPGNITIHNHPDGGTFSTADLSDIGHGATEIRAAAPEGTYILRNIRRGTRWVDGQKTWVDMRDDLDAAAFDFKSGYRLKKEVSESFKAENDTLKDISSRWSKARESGASQEELQKYVDEYTSLANDLRARVEVATRKAYTDQYHNWYKQNAMNYGLEYEFIPTPTRANKSYYAG